MFLYDFIRFYVFLYAFIVFSGILCVVVLFVGICRYLSVFFRKFYYCVDVIVLYEMMLLHDRAVSDQS